ncbi:MAG: enoyl-CoA hydratase/isomerase family protein [Pseudomonadales bacterium]
MNDDVMIEVTDGVALVTLNRPEALNTFNYGVLEGLGAAYKRCDEDDEIRCVVVTGAGRAFCAGADLSGGGETFDSSDREDISSCPLAMQAWEVRKPVIAACNGHAIGVGMGIAAQCDIRIVAAEAKYGFLQNRRGVVVDFGMSWLLPRLVGFEKAFELLVRAQRMSGADVVEAGLASRCVPAEEVLQVALEMAADYADNCAPLVSGLHKRLLWKGLDSNFESAVADESLALNHSMRKPDALEGGVAYFEKRTPQWTGSVNKDWPEGL